MKISLVIPAYNEERYIGACLEAVCKHRDAFHEILVVDNNSTDRTAQIVGQYPGVTLLHESKKGPAFARESGWRASTGDIVGFIDADTRVPDNWPDAVQKYFGKDQELVCLSGPYVFYDMGSVQSALVKAYFYAAIPFFWFTKAMAILGNMAVRRSALEKIGGIDTAIEFYGDDTDLARRLGAVGKGLFTLSFPIYTSARRLHGEGIIHTAFNYVMAFICETFLRKHWNRKYTEVR